MVHVLTAIIIILIVYNTAKLINKITDKLVKASNYLKVVSFELKMFLFTQI